MTDLSQIQTDPTKKDTPEKDPTKTETKTDPTKKVTDKDDPKPVPYDRFQQVIQERNELQSKMDALAKAQKDREDKELADQEKWKELAEKREAELEAERLGTLRLRTAMEAGIPVEMADRLRGETAEELKADAEGLLDFLKPSKGPGTPPNRPGNGPAKIDLENMTPADIRKRIDEHGYEGIE